jgi:ABC-type Na+ efflux pump permease subunit
MKRKIVPVLLLVLFVVVLPLTLAFGMYLKSGQPCPIDIERLETCVAVAYIGPPVAFLPAGFAIVAIIVLLLRMIFKKDRK